MNSTKDDTACDGLDKRKNACLKKRTYITGFGEYRDEVPIRTDIPVGGIVERPKPAPDYLPPPPLEYREYNDSDNEIDTGRIEEWTIDGPRRHNVFALGREIVYFPTIYGNYPFNSRYCKSAWTDWISFSMPDKEYIADLQRFGPNIVSDMVNCSVMFHEDNNYYHAIMGHMHLRSLSKYCEDIVTSHEYLRILTSKTLIVASFKFKKLSTQYKIDRLMLNDSLYRLSWFSPSVRQHFISLIGEVLRNQRVTWFSAENCHFLLDDGLRLLIAISLGGGHSLETLHLWKYFRPGQQPILPDEVNEEYTLDDPFIRTREKDIPDKKLLSCIWNQFVAKPAYTIPRELRDLLFTCSLQCLDHLRVLSVEYGFLTGGQGNKLCSLGCLRSGTLRYLNLLFSTSDLPSVSKRYISRAAWKTALKLNPNFQVNLVSIHVAQYDHLQQILTPKIPLESIYISSGAHPTLNSVFLCSTCKLLREYYKWNLKRITIHITKKRIMADLIITKFLTELPFLEEFEFRGQIDKLQTIEWLFDYLLDYSLWIRKLHIYVIEDPRFDNTPYRAALDELYSKYKDKFQDRKLNILLTMCKI